MRKLLMILATATLTVTVNTGCDVDASLEGGRMIVIDKIFVDWEKGWKVATVNGGFDYFYADIPLAELTEYIFDRGDFTTYMRYTEQREGDVVDVQEELPVVVNLERVEDNRLIAYTETISCSYEIGYMRIAISRSDFFNRPPDKTLYFRTVIYY